MLVFVVELGRFFFFNRTSFYYVIYTSSLSNYIELILLSTI